MKRRWILLIFLVVFIIGGVSYAADAKRKYCRSGADPFDTTYRLNEGEREIELSEDLFVINQGKRSKAKCWLKKGDKVTLVTADDDKEYIDRKTTCNNPLLSPAGEKILWDDEEESISEDDSEIRPQKNASSSPSVPAPVVVQVRKVKVLAPAISLSVNALKVYKGEQVLLTWNSQNAEKVLIGDKDMGSIMGSAQTNPILEKTTFTATALSVDNQKALASVTITAMDIPCSARKSGWGSVIGGLLGAGAGIATMNPWIALGGGSLGGMIGGYLDGKCISPSDVTTSVSMGAAGMAITHVAKHPDAEKGDRGDKGDTGPQGPEGPAGSSSGGGPSPPPPIPPPGPSPAPPPPIVVVGPSPAPLIP